MSEPGAPPLRPASLLKVLGVAFGVAVIVGNTIGVGILRTPGEIAARLPETRWFLGVWVVGGAYALLGALTLAELGAMVPRSGGQYVFARRALGEYAGFVVGWSDWVSSCASVTVAAIAIGEFSGDLVPALAGGGALVGVAIVLGFTGLQWLGVRPADQAQQLLSALKTLALVALVVLCFAAPAAPRLELAGAAGTAGAPEVAGVGATAGAVAAAAQAPWSLAFPSGLALLGAVVIALQGVIYTYDGWSGVLYFSGEVRRPGRDIPRAMAGGVLTVIAVYVALNLAFLHVLPLERMAGQTMVAAAAAGAVLGPRGDQVLRAIMIVSLLGQTNAILMMCSRVPHAMSDDRLLPRGLGRVNQGGTPAVALLGSAGLALLLLATKTFSAVLALAAFFFVLNYTLSFVSLLVLRRREPETERPYRAWGYPWVPGLLVLGSLAFLVGSVVGDTRNSVRSLVILAASWPVYQAIRWGRGRLP